MLEIEVLSSKEPEEIMYHIQETRADLSKKLETMGSVIKGDAQEVAQYVEQKVADVKRAFNVRQHIENHPWKALAGAVGVGFLCGKVFLKSDNGQQSTTQSTSSSPQNSRPLSSLILMGEIISIALDVGDKFRRMGSKPKSE